MLSEEQKRKVEAVQAAQDKISQYNLPMGMNACRMGIGIYCCLQGEPENYRFGSPEKFAGAINDMYRHWRDNEHNPVPPSDFVSYLHAYVGAYEALSGRKVKRLLDFEVVGAENAQTGLSTEDQNEFQPPDLQP